MGVITKEVEMLWNARNKKWFVEKYYIFTKMGDIFKVDIKDLKNGSSAQIDIECDGCGKKLKNKTWRHYKTYVKENGKYYCTKCASNLYGRNNIKKTKLKKSKSFEQWCVENNKQDVLDRWDYKLNEYTPAETFCYTPIKFWFKCPKGFHQSELKSIKSYTLVNKDSLYCKVCNSFAQWGIDNIDKDFLDKYWDWNKNNELEIDPWKVNRAYNKKVFIICQEKNYHESYPVSCHGFFQGNRCPYCSGKSLNRLDSLGILCPEIIEIWSNKNQKTPYEYSLHSTKRIWWKCENKKHEDYYRSIHATNQCKFCCPACVKERNESFLQEKVRTYINKLGYKILHENNCNVKCINPKTGYPLPYDNEVVGLELIIEVHGKQHYDKLIGSWFEVDLHQRKLYDRYKRIFAKYMVMNT
jgi:hypothetical protein